MKKKTFQRGIAAAVTYPEWESIMGLDGERICLTTMENLSKDSFKGLDVMTAGTMNEILRVQADVYYICIQ